MCLQIAIVVFWVVSTKNNGFYIMNSYIDKNGKQQYIDEDEKRKCLGYDKTCNKNSRLMACNVPWWTSGYWAGWWGWNSEWDVLGENLTYLYSEIDGPEWVFCGDYYYGWYWFYGGSMDCGINGSDCANTTNTDCGRPRLKNCKRYNCITNNNVDDCTIINGKDREQRCCKKPSNFSCEPGECDYEYSIVKKEYSVDYERVSGGGNCVDEKGYYESFPETSCYNGVLTVNNICTTSVYGCSPQNECSPDSCKEAEKEGWTKEGDEPTHGVWYDYGLWYGVSWEYDQIDCDCPSKGCNSCAECSEYDCESYGSSYYLPGSWSYWGGYYGGLGSDCCGTPPAICPKAIGNGSKDSWWCTGSDCIQMSEEEGESSGYSGPSSSYNACIKNCGTAESTNCVTPDYTYITGLCCDTEFMDRNQKRVEDGECLDTGPSHETSKKQTLCTDSSGCGGSSTYDYKTQNCSFIPTYCKTKKVVRTRGYYTFSYEQEIPDKDYECNCIQCSPNDECKQQECYKCPAGSQKPITVKNLTVKSGGGEVLDEATVKLIVVYCKINTIECKKEESSENTGGI